jgi:threonine dehydratase
LHTRHGEGLEIGEVELRVSVETMGHEHRERVLQALVDAGLQPRITQA